MTWSARDARPLSSSTKQNFEVSVLEHANSAAKMLKIFVYSILKLIYLVRSGKKLKTTTFAICHSLYNMKLPQLPSFRLSSFIAEWSFEFRNGVATARWLQLGPEIVNTLRGGREVGLNVIFLLRGRGTL